MNAVCRLWVVIMCIGVKVVLVVDPEVVFDQKWIQKGTECVEVD